MKLCDTCIYKNKYELEKPCVIYSDHCKLYKKDKGNVKAIIEIDVPEFQIGQEVSIYFKDTMMIKGIVRECKVESEE